MHIGGVGIRDLAENKATCVHVIRRGSIFWFEMLYNMGGGAFVKGED